MKSHLIDLERRALQFQKCGQLKEAIGLFTAIVNEQPDWEHGSAFYNLACSYEDLGEFALAEQCFGDALKYEPNNPYFLGGLASFLYLHGDPVKAFEAYLNLLNVERINSNARGIEASMAALSALGNKIGMSEEVFLKTTKDGKP